MGDISPNNYDAVAGYYDLLSRLVFGRAEINAQLGLLRLLKPGGSLLIVGGGTGWVLEEIADLFPAGLRIVYVESSQKMMEKVRKREWGESAVELVCAPVEDWNGEERFDAILTGFFFDNFSEQHAGEILRLLDKRLNAGGLWLNADFYYPPGNGRWWHGLLLRSMYIATRILCRVEANKLPDMAGLFDAVGYKTIGIADHYGGFIRAVAYQK